MFGELVTVKEALQLLDDALREAWGGDRPWEEMPLLECLGRVAARDLRSPVDLPGFARSTVDGYAVRASDTFGASESLPIPLRLVGEVAMGQGAEVPLGPGECQRIATGGMLPPNADGVVMLEYAQELGDGFVEIMRGISPGKTASRPMKICARATCSSPRAGPWPRLIWGLWPGLGCRKSRSLKDP